MHAGYGRFTALVGGAKCYSVLIEGGNAIEAMVAAAATVFDRIFYQGMSPQAAVNAPRWLLGRTWGESSDTLKIERCLSQTTTDTLKRYGHHVETYPPYDGIMGHVSAVIRHAGRRKWSAQRRLRGSLVKRLSYTRCNFQVEPAVLYAI